MHIAAKALSSLANIPCTVQWPEYRKPTSQLKSWRVRSPWTSIFLVCLAKVEIIVTEMDSFELSWAGSPVTMSPSPDIHGAGFKVNGSREPMYIFFVCAVPCMAYPRVRTVAAGPHKYSRFDTPNVDEVAVSMLLIYTVQSIHMTCHCKSLTGSWTVKILDGRGLSAAEAGWLWRGFGHFFAKKCAYSIYIWLVTSIDSHLYNLRSPFLTRTVNKFWISGVSLCISSSLSFFWKETIKKYMDELTESARIIGAVNTAACLAGMCQTPAYGDALCSALHN